MFDNLRQASERSDLFADQERSPKRARRGPRRRIFGMTTGQRFILSLLLLGTAIVMAIMCLVVTGKVFL